MIDDRPVSPEIIVFNGDASGQNHPKIICQIPSDKQKLVFTEWFLSGMKKAQSLLQLFFTISLMIFCA